MSAFNMLGMDAELPEQEIKLDPVVCRQSLYFMEFLVIIFNEGYIYFFLFNVACYLVLFIFS